MTKQRKLNGASPKQLQQVSELETALNMEGKIKQMDFQDFQEVTMTDYEQEAFKQTVVRAEAAKAKADDAIIILQKAQADIQAANNEIATVQIVQETIFDMVRRRAGFAGKQNWYDPQKRQLIIDPN